MLTYNAVIIINIIINIILEGGDPNGKSVEITGEGGGDRDNAAPDDAAAAPKRV